MLYATAQPGTTAHLTFPRLGWLTFQQPEKVTVVRDYPAEQQAEIQLSDGSLALYPYTGRLEVRSK